VDRLKGLAVVVLVDDCTTPIRGISKEVPLLQGLTLWFYSMNSDWNIRLQEDLGASPTSHAATIHTYAL
jgi:hypothetical protein